MMKTTVSARRVHPKLVKPRKFDSRERFMEGVRQHIFASQLPYKTIAQGVGCSPRTINKIASGETSWPKHTTLFPLLDYLSIELTTNMKKGK